MEVSGEVAGFISLFHLDNQGVLRGPPRRISTYVFLSERILLLLDSTNTRKDARTFFYTKSCDDNLNFVIVYIYNEELR